MTDFQILLDKSLQTAYYWYLASHSIKTEEERRLTVKFTLNYFSRYFSPLFALKRLSHYDYYYDYDYYDYYYYY